LTERVRTSQGQDVQDIGSAYDFRFANDERLSKAPASFLERRDIRDADRRVVHRLVLSR
jgi:hypothetical protein